MVSVSVSRSELDNMTSKMPIEGSGGTRIRTREPALNPPRTTETASTMMARTHRSLGSDAVFGHHISCSDRSATRYFLDHSFAELGASTVQLERLLQLLAWGTGREEPTPVSNIVIDLSSDQSWASTFRGLACLPVMRVKQEGRCSAPIAAIFLFLLSTPSTVLWYGQL